MASPFSAPGGRTAIVPETDKYLASLFAPNSSFRQSSTAMSLINTANQTTARRGRRNTNTDGTLLHKDKNSDYSPSSSEEEVAEGDFYLCNVLCVDDVGFTDP
jgi:hypothetical protein